MNTSEKRTTGVMDLFFVLLLLLGLIGLGLRLVGAQGDGGTPTDTRTVVAGARSVSATAADCLSVGETLYTADGEAFGVVEAIELRAARVEMTSLGVTYTGEWEASERVDLTVSIRITGQMGEDAFLRAGVCATLIGDEVSLFGERFFGVLRILSVEVD